MKAVPTHTPKGELLAGWWWWWGGGGDLHLSLNSPWRLCLAPQAWAVLPQAPGHAVPMPRPSPSVPEATKPPGTTGFRMAGGGPGSTWEVTWLQFCCPSHWKTRSAWPWPGLFYVQADHAGPVLAAGEGVPPALLPTGCPPLLLSCPTWLCGSPWLVPLAGALNFSLNESFLC